MYFILVLQLQQVLIQKEHIHKMSELNYNSRNVNNDPKDEETELVILNSSPTGCK